MVTIYCGRRGKFLWHELQKKNRRQRIKRGRPDAPERQKNSSSLKLYLRNIGGIPRVLDASQCNDSYSPTLIALKLKEIFALNDVNK